MVLLVDYWEHDWILHMCFVFGKSVRKRLERCNEEGEMMANKVKQKNRLRKAIKSRQKTIEKFGIEIAWRNYWIKNGVLKG